MLVGRLEIRLIGDPGRTFPWRPVPVTLQICHPTNDLTEAATAIADQEAEKRHRDDPATRAHLWHYDRRIRVYQLPDGAATENTDYSTLTPLAERLLLGGHHLTGTPWWLDYEGARRIYMDDASRGLAVHREQAEQSWANSRIRTALLDLRPPTVDTEPEPDPILPTDPWPPEENDTMRFSDDSHKLPIPPGKSHMMAQVLHALALHEAARWWVPAQHPEPGPDVLRVFDGHNHHVRTPDNLWEAEPTDAIPAAATPSTRRRWAHFGYRIVVDATPAPAGDQLGPWVPTRDPEPGPEVTRVFNGAHHFKRQAHGRWRQEKPAKPAKPDEETETRMFITWAGLGDQSVIDSTPAPRQRPPAADILDDAEQDDAVDELLLRFTHWLKAHGQLTEVPSPEVADDLDDLVAHFLAEQREKANTQREPNPGQ